MLRQGVKAASLQKYMLEQLINSLDQRGILVIQAMLGKRAIDILEEEKKSESKVETPKKKLILNA